MIYAIAHRLSASVRLCLTAGLCLSATVLSTPAVITWNVTYGDIASGTHIGFDDPVLGGTRQATFEAALDYVNSVLDAAGTVDFELTASLSDGGGSLASAGSFFFTGSNGFQNGLVYQHATTGIDPALDVPDGSATFDFGFNWNNDLDAPAPSEIDLFSVSLHEISHALGFSSLLDSNGVSQIGSQANPGVYTVYDSLLQDENGNALFETGGTFVGDTNDLISANVYFGGTSAVLSYGSPVPVYAPDPFASGSSISHITPPGAVMTYAIAYGVQKREYQPVELAIFEDIGWTLTAIPEPAALAMMAIAVLGLLRVRKRGNPPTA